MPWRKARLFTDRDGVTWTVSLAPPSALGDGALPHRRAGLPQPLRRVLRFERAVTTAVRLSAEVPPGAPHLLDSELQRLLDASEAVAQGAEGEVGQGTATAAPRDAHCAGRACLAPERVPFAGGPLAGLYVKRSVYDTPSTEAMCIWVLEDGGGARGVHRGHRHIRPTLAPDERVLGGYEYAERTGTFEWRADPTNAPHATDGA